MDPKLCSLVYDVSIFLFLDEDDESTYEEEDHSQDHQQQQQELQENQLAGAKGQLISEWLFVVLNFPKKQHKNLMNFCSRI